ncbi:MAG: hypothetical protein MJY62_02105, partial [Bacteroidales bacterium]|nr:hypothetical protein [Bacteroidales bacterium]
EDKIPTENMILDGKGNFYTLMYAESSANSSLKLYKFNIENGSYETFGDDIPMLTDRLTCQAKLFYCPEQSVLVATKIEDDVESGTIASAFTIRTIDARRRIIFVFGVSLLAFFLAFTLLVVWLTRRFRRKYRESHNYISTPNDRAASIYLFGDFTVYSDSGEVITSIFYTKLRQMACLLINRFGKNGISTHRLTEKLWPDREDDNVKNIRGVTMNHFRKALAKIGGVTVAYSDGRYYLSCEPPFYCDYLELMQLMGEKNPDMDKVLAILSRGRILSSENDPVIEPVKEDMERTVIPVVQAEIERRFKIKQYQNVLLCAKILAEIDPVDEDAMRYGVLSLIALGRKEEARQRYNEYRKKYSAYYGERYSLDYENLIK